MWNAAGPIVFITVIAVVVILVCREIICWYWKMNRVVELLEKIEKNTSKEKLS